MLVALATGSSADHGLAADASSGSQDQAEFFETRIRPVLAENCFECHGEDVQENGLRLDSLQAMLDGGDFGRAVTPGKPNQSLLLLAVRHEDALRMPPERKLTTRQIVDLTRWIEMGAPWPNAKAELRERQGTPGSAEVTAEDRQFWAFRPLQIGEPPVAAEERWNQTAIDRHLRTALATTGLSPAPPADRRAWIRRATYDLHGLPPTRQEVAAFVADQSSDAYLKVIDRLLASPRYGERWGRHWLDVARYADSNGLDENICHANAFRYRDYVIDAFNSDKPYDQFVCEQIAGDLLPAAEDELQRRSQLIATGFLAIGAKMLACDDGKKMRMDIVDEQLNTLSQAFLGLTIGCARCHDHKFDPIPMSDYYALAGIFRSTKTMDNYKVVAKWFERPVPTPQWRERERAHRQKVEAKQAETAAQIAAADDLVLSDVRQHQGDYLLAAADRLRRLRQAGTLRQSLESQDFKPPTGAQLIEAEHFARGTAIKSDSGYGEQIGVVLSSGASHVEYDLDLPAAGTYVLALRYAAAEARSVELQIDGQLILPAVASEVTGGWYPPNQQWYIEDLLELSAGKQTIRLQREVGPFPHIDKLLLMRIDLPDDQRASSFAGEDEASRPRLHAVLVKALANGLRELGDEPSLEQARQLLASDKNPLEVPAVTRQLYPADTLAKVTALEKELEDLKAARPTEMMAMGVTEGPEIGDMPIHHRGNYYTPGPVVERGFLQVLDSRDQLQIDSSQSGRLQLARWITQPDSRAGALAARVMANRIWRWHFGQGLVKSTDNFGALGQRPSHPELLDFLADYFIQNGWSIKAMHRLIMNTAAYRLSTADDRNAAAVDPENRLLWRMNRHRLEAEAVRDTLLVLGGTLDTTMGGTVLKVKNHDYVTTSGSAITDEYDHPRRSVYLPVVRSAMYEPLATFDFPDPAYPSGDRASTTIAPQALFMTNSQLVHDQMGRLASRLLNGKDQSDSERIDTLYEEIFSRKPDELESTRARQFVDNYSAQAGKLLELDEAARRLRAWQALCRVLISTNEFIYVE